MTAKIYHLGEIHGLDSTCGVEERDPAVVAYKSLFPIE